ncbi:unnamed protein product, partial [Meganyctiphanes norvegica]
EFKTLIDPECQPLWLLVELPIDIPPQEPSHDLSSSHALVRRCIGVNDEHKACVSKQRWQKTENWNVVKVFKGSNKRERIHVSWISHEKCMYKRRKESECPIEDARKCHKKRTTHYYDEVTCTCSCIVKIDGENTCRAKAVKQISLITDNDIDSLENEVANEDNLENEVGTVTNKDEVENEVNILTNEDSLQNEVITVTNKSEVENKVAKYTRIEKIMDVVTNEDVAQQDRNTKNPPSRVNDQHNKGHVGCVTSRGRPGRCIAAVPCKALFLEQDSLSVRDFTDNNNGGCPARRIEDLQVCCPLHSRPLVKQRRRPKPKWPPPGPVAYITIEPGTSSLLLRWHDPLNLKSGEYIDAFRVIWLSAGSTVKHCVLEASKLLSPERQLTIKDLHINTEYTVTIEAKLKSEDDFSIPTVRRVKTLANGDSRIFYLGG